MHQNSFQPAATPCACTALRKAVRTLDRLYDAALLPHGMTTTQFALLRNIHRAGEIVLSHLASALVMDRTSLYRTIRSVEAAGWVEIVAGGGRARLARLTVAGRDAMQAAEPAWQVVQDEVGHRLGAQGWAGLMETSARVVALGREA